ncbi:MAG: phosphatidylinositol kinase [Gammaproteobacteria bacterium RIFCSPLOWO2_02_FULL_42_14]|nr:MAG: phosphatidylinositol kinase [Gammaproteobacteria bacterium RIFCSPHIGHO2_02_FULL_42_43]OGT27283.1 MAG: phosphatidylinositol kinase [Gammaproteobacteria bacterium RIFCSPHIGHO2_01_FULL_42_8]OGT52957.1 MAG: phosphatidylinositol kinase [Gammaproteobacteria bacterium RIFCSPHIGHO2_12_FULL_41_25]OGT61269.1 MAG: phosphatidylinositol kinase [Gammaproteobacteria bacterium RIFCSPLOWO2_02_FULL_42_14]OGT87198.1 MAG: phosphatidylinositol kinase [Gammaproteobacteria bacterium RIFCSPLOWO2_12_FULL_42_18]
MNYIPVTEIKVSLDFGEKKIVPVGRLAIRNHQIYFEYGLSFLKNPLPISPLRFPVEPGLKTIDRNLLEGLPGLFYDSLPDGWGRLLLDRSLRQQGILSNQLTPLDRLAHVGKTGMGALIYEPDFHNKTKIKKMNLDYIALHSQKILDGEADNVLQTLLALNGSSAGARPKIMIGVDHHKKNMVYGAHALPKKYMPWIVKFPNLIDGRDAGAIEYVYSLMAREAGLTMTDTHLFSTKKGAYFATQRFDRDHKKRIHAHTAAGLLNIDFRTSSLDYQDLLSLTEMLTRDNREVEKMYRQAVFNVLSHNRDDHAKNFSFLMNEQGEWILSPAYDLTFSSGPGGEQSMTVRGKGKNITKDDLIKLGTQIKLDNKIIKDCIAQTQHALSQWKLFAKQYSVSMSNIKLIQQELNV